MSYRGLGDLTLFSGLTLPHPPLSLSLSLSLSLTISFSSLRPNHLQPSLLAPPRSTYYYRCCLSCLRLPPLQPLLHPPPERQTRHIARSVALLPSEAPRRSILYNYPACITKVAAKLFLPFRATLQCHLLQHRPTSPSAHSSPTVRLTPSFSLFLSLSLFLSRAFRAIRFSIVFHHFSLDFRPSVVSNERIRPPVFIFLSIIEFSKSWLRLYYKVSTLPFSRRFYFGIFIYFEILGTVFSEGFEGAF